MKKFKFILSAICLLFLFTIISYGETHSITGDNNYEETYKKHYPVIKITNHSNKDITVEWGAYGDEFQGDISVPANSTINLELEELSFLGADNETTTVWLTWTEEGSLKPKGTDVITLPFELKDTHQPEFG